MANDLACRGSGYDVMLVSLLPLASRLSAPRTAQSYVSLPSSIEAIMLHHTVARHKCVASL